MGQSIFCSKSADIHASVFQVREFTKLAIKMHSGYFMTLGGYRKVLFVFQGQTGSFSPLRNGPVYFLFKECRHTSKCNSGEEVYRNGYQNA